MKINNWTLKLRKTEKEILQYLLERHIDEGNYFGRKEYHYKMTRELLEKIKDIGDIVIKPSEAFN